MDITIEELPTVRSRNISAGDGAKGDTGRNRDG